MNEMIERVARALHQEIAGSDPDELIHHPAQKSWEAPTRRRWEQWEEAARTVIEAMGEPTEAMLRAAFVAMNETPGGQWKQMKAEGVTPRRLFDVKMAPRYRAMIAAARA